jgi:MarR family transcriptional regulator, organic hydroperoxide resistance regulator
LNLDLNHLQESLFDLIDQVKIVISQEIWDNLLLNCTKNELFVLMLLYRKSDVNMTQIAEYLGAPLNTTTGIVSRMEKKNMVSRVRNDLDKRVVTIHLTDFGHQQISEIIGMFMHYGEKIITSLKAEELSLMSDVVGKVISILQDNPVNKPPSDHKIRKINIE